MTPGTLLWPHVHLVSASMRNARPFQSFVPSFTHTVTECDLMLMARGRRRSPGGALVPLQEPVAMGIGWPPSAHTAQSVTSPGGSPGTLSVCITLWLRHPTAMTCLLPGSLKSQEHIGDRAGFINQGHPNTFHSLKKIMRD